MSLKMLTALIVASIVLVSLCIAGPALDTGNPVEPTDASSNSLISTTLNEVPLGGGVKMVLTDPEGSQIDPDLLQKLSESFGPLPKERDEVVNQNDEAPEVVEVTKRIMGLYSRRHIPPSDMEITVPTRVSPDGSFISHTLASSHTAPHRFRRSLSEDEVDLAAPVLHYNLTVGGRAIRLDLRPEMSFISPQLVVERLGPGGGTRAPPASGTTCHYRGHVAGQPASSVALSACDGLAGLLRTHHGEYWVEPAAHQGRLPEGAEHPHVIFKRSAVRRGRKPPGEGRKKGMGKKKTGPGGRKRRRRRGSNCATKEPQHTKLLEWKEGPGQMVIQQPKEDKGLGRQMNEVTDNNRNPHAGRLYRGPAQHSSPNSWSEERSRRGSRENTWPDGKSRRPRSISKPRHVEVLLVADSSMADFHQKGNVETYLLTIMNMVSSLYLDPTIGNFINVVVVKITLLEEHSIPHLNITTNADTTLSNFCRWQRDRNPVDDKHPHHHDVAILITRMDICARQNVPCSTLGVAHVAGMCLPDRSCSVNEDNGITLAHTITHELGHNFGMYHDTEKIGCHRRVGSTLHVMTPIFEADTVEVAWSRCSQRDLTNFLDSGMGECLADEPAQLDYIYPELPPGALYDASQQCRLQFGTSVFQVCAELSEICERLWCMYKGTCTTMLRPAAPGTTCGPDMWCQNNTCVARTMPPPPLHGGWGVWGDWSPCSRSCGAGISTITRLCNNPVPSHGGNFCTGERTKYKVCNTDPCPKSEPSFRQVQCSKHDNTTHNKMLVAKWQPYFDQDEPCELYCSSTDETIIAQFGDYALDGTPCNLGTRDMCIAGICKKVGCDWIVDSDAVEDACGICNGNGDECKQVQGIYSKGTTKESGYSEVAIIPAGSRNIKVEEVSNSKNYIGIGSANSRRFYLNGKRKIKMAGEYLVAGTPALYERDRDWEKIKIPGPIREDILIYQMIYRGRHRNPGVRYQYTVDRASGSDKAEAQYRWGAADWTQCTRECGGGITKQPIVCLDAANNVVDQEYCIGINEMAKPSEIMRYCNDFPCPAYWWAGNWTSCPPCLKGHHQPHRRRKVICKDRNDHRPLPDHRCEKKTKPVMHIICAGLTKCASRHP